MANNHGDLGVNGAAVAVGTFVGRGSTGCSQGARARSTHVLRSREIRRTPSSERVAAVQAQTEPQPQGQPAAAADPQHASVASGSQRAS